MSTKQPTGQALNSLIAERVMGWTEWRGLTKDCPNLPGVTYFADWGDKGGVAVYEADDRTGDVSFYFNPAAEIADAWLVVERLRSVGWIVRVQEMPDGAPFMLGSGWEKEPNPELHRRALCALYPTRELEQRTGMGLGRTFNAFAETSPLAICHAALGMVEKVGALERAQGAQASVESFGQH